MIFSFLLCFSIVLGSTAGGHNARNSAANSYYRSGSSINTNLGFQRHLVRLINNTKNPAEKEYDSYKSEYLLRKYEVAPANFSRCSDKGICSTWGANHFFTFDNDLYQFSGSCNYVLATVCQSTTPEFNIQVQRSGGASITRIIIQIGLINVVVQGSTTVVLGRTIALPYTANGIEITKTGAVTRLYAKQKDFELIVTWSTDGNLMVEVDQRFMNRICGLCGNYNGIPKDDFMVDGKLAMPYQFANLHQIDDPGVTCPFQVPPGKTAPKKSYTEECYSLLKKVSSSCSVSRIPFLKLCQLDMQSCARPGDASCVCATLAQYSMRCAMCNQPINNWRTKQLCPLEACPANQIYRECAAPCSPTCSNPTYTCSSHCVHGCFCPPGTVLDDLSKNLTCVPVSQCPCVVNGKRYYPGERIKSDCSDCKCHMGQWSCTSTPCPGRCSLEGGSFVTTFDTNMYRFHGDCVYILVTNRNPDNQWTIMATFEKCGTSSTETCLESIIYTASTGAIVMSKEDHITVDSQIKQLPFNSEEVNVIRVSSTNFALSTKFGLEIVIHRAPVLNVYIKMSRSYFGTTKGLCGNFNGETMDDFMSSSGVIEGTIPIFVDSWKAASNCLPAQNSDVNPCSLSYSNENYAKSHCSALMNSNSPFAACSALVNLDQYYTKCVYEACNYQETNNFICSAMASYARACAAKGVILQNWRESTNCTVQCPGNQTYSYNTTSCGRTCLSLSNKELECYPNDIPVEGCNCPTGFYLDNKNMCVRKESCPCYLDANTILLPQQQTTYNGLTCICSSGSLNCIGFLQAAQESCPAPKMMKTCDSLTDKYGAACAPTCQLLATGISCIPTKCVSGCVCPSGTYEDLDGNCVNQTDCSCEFGGEIYKTGDTMQSECQSCTCNGGHWNCEANLNCASTCVLYGESHIKTFDGQQFVFEGNCEYTLVTDGCGVNNSLSSFKIVSENVVCGTTGVTCSRAITAFIGDTTLKMFDEKYTVTGVNDIKVLNNTLFIEFVITIPHKFKISILWNKDMNVFIKVFKLGKQSVCGLCGNYNGNVKDDYQTRSKYVTSNALDFINSWKESPMCNNVRLIVSPCDANPHRKPWATSSCSIINSQTFDACHKVVNSQLYYESCVNDACGCDTGGDCTCMCDAVQAYAKACLAAGVCVDWRTPDFCPVYCDYKNTHVSTGDGYVYSPDVNCTWHYQPCQCPFALQAYPHQNFEGCYQCGPDKYFDPEQNTCLPCVEHSTTTIEPSTSGTSVSTPATTPVPTSATATTVSTPGTTPVPTSATATTVSTPGTTPVPTSATATTVSTPGTTPVSTSVTTTSVSTPVTTPVSSSATATSVSSSPPVTITTIKPTEITSTRITTVTPKPSTSVIVKTTPTTSTTLSKTTSTSHMASTKFPTSQTTHPSSSLASTISTTTNPPVTTTKTTPPVSTTNMTVTPVTSESTTTVTSTATTTETKHTEATHTTTISNSSPSITVTFPVTSSTPKENTTTHHTTPHVTAPDQPSTSTPASVCSIQQYQHTITQNGCSANVTLTKCHGYCESESWYNDDFTSVEENCGCCAPQLNTAQSKDVDLKCPNATKSVTVTIKIFKECICNYKPCANSAKANPGKALA
uniref:Mucin 6, oligomeric mucus/gel-forming n=1 Tax=Xenopus tropicalis TaxID=8364 RepID=A0A803KB07_XENTR